MAGSPEPSTGRRGRPAKRSRSDAWDLYNVHEDLSLENNLASAQAEKLRELQGLFIQCGGGEVPRAAL